MDYYQFSCWQRFGLWLVDLFDKSMVQNLLSTLIGAGLGATFGIPAGLAIERRKSMSQRKERANTLKTGLKSALAANKVLIDSIKEQYKPLYTPTNWTNVDLTFLQSTASLRYETIDDPVLNRSIDETFHRLKSLHSDVQQLLGLLHSNSMTLGAPTRRLADKIQTDCQSLSAMIDEVLRKV